MMSSFHHSTNVQKTVMRTVFNMRNSTKNMEIFLVIYVIQVSNLRVLVHATPSSFCYIYMDYFSETTSAIVLILNTKLKTIITTLHTNKRLMQLVFEQAHYSRDV